MRLASAYDLLCLRTLNVKTSKKWLNRRADAGSDQ